MEQSHRVDMEAQWGKGEPRPEVGLPGSPFVCR